MSLRRTALSVASAFIAGTGLLAGASPAGAADPSVTLTLSNPVVVNYVDECRPQAEIDYMIQGAGVSRGVMIQISPDRKAYTAPIRPGQGYGLGVGCATVPEFGKWTVKVTAYDGKGNVLAQRSVSYYQKGNTQIKEFNAAPEPVTKGRPIKVAGRLLRIKYGSAPWYIAYAKQPMKIYFKQAGTTTWTYMGTATTASNGRFSKTFTAKRDGYWRAFFPGKSTYIKKASSTDYVDVR